jgi:hypothetical protein
MDGHAGALISRVMREFLAGAVPPNINSGIVVAGSPILFLPEAGNPASPLLVDHRLTNNESNRIPRIQFQMVRAK